ncbi:hypothetical protein Trichorick_01066 [Candidatus Trichorickettsia mobilis]|uniref:Uncharacterized protein n=1 Tax=Candidatus Trichorickettsia mobilis TaxID=1346319 RepID=A0ABZ0UX03_9RICK|nr:hypothetical protein Trichorick_01066 [Candidatus Trichorickettsia mobilis]
MIMILWKPIIINKEIVNLDSVYVVCEIKQKIT